MVMILWLGKMLQCSSAVTIYCPTEQSSFTFVSIIFLDVQNTLKWNGMEPKIIRFSISSIIVNYLMGYW